MLQKDLLGALRGPALKPFICAAWCCCRSRMRKVMTPSLRLRSKSTHACTTSLAGNERLPAFRFVPDIWRGAMIEPWFQPSLLLLHRTCAHACAAFVSSTTIWSRHPSIPTRCPMSWRKAPKDHFIKLVFFHIIYCFVIQGHPSKW